MPSVVFDSAVVASVAAAAVLVLLALITRWSWFGPAWIWAVAVAVALPLAEFDVGRYGTGALSPYPLWRVVLLLVALVVFVGSVARSSHDRVAQTDLTVAAAAFACGLFVYIPETDLLRVAPGPLLVIAAVAVLSLLPPLRGLGLLAVTVVLLWISLVDGAARDGTILATAASLSLASLAPLVGAAALTFGNGAGGGAAPGSTDAPEPGVVSCSEKRKPASLPWLLGLVSFAAAVVVVARLLGTTSSEVAPAVAVLIVVAAGAHAIAAASRHRPLVSSRPEA